MISIKHRFHGRGALNHTYRNGKIIRAHSLSLKYVRSRGSDYRLAVVVGKKVHKSAVIRNRIRRRIYEIVRLYQKESQDPLPADIILTVYRDDLIKMPNENLKQLIADLIQKVKF